MKDLYYDTLASPIGDLLLVVDGEKLCSLDYVEYEQRMLTLLKRRYGSLDLVRCGDPQGFSSRIQAYLNGDISGLDDIPVQTGGTAFQQQVWLALREIPLGSTTTYGKLAARIGRPSAYRAVGAANSLNPIAIVLPCHRVVGSDDSLTGYAGGLERKDWLLRHERAMLLKQSREGQRV